jgi:hypothetical protein
MLSAYDTDIKFLNVCTIARNLCEWCPEMLVKIQEHNSVNVTNNQSINK